MMQGDCIIREGGGVQKRHEQGLMLMAALRPAATLHNVSLYAHRVAVPSHRTRRRWSELRSR